MVLAWLVNVLFALLVISAAAFMLCHRRRDRKAREATRELVISPMSGLVMGAMLLSLHSIVQPQVRHMVAEEQKEAFEDENGHEPPGGMLLHLQLRQIQKGEAPGGLTFHIDRQDPPYGAREENAGMPPLPLALRVRSGSASA
jgi:hypothetical protein